MRQAIAIILFVINSSLSMAADLSYDQHEIEKRQKLDDLANSCLQSKKKDKLCDAIITAKQIGDDSVEFIKEYMELTPAEYAALTMLNYAATGRFRIRSQSFIMRKANHTYDWQRDKFTFIFEIKY